MPRLGQDLSTYLREAVMPTVWCPGCGHGNIAAAITTAMKNLELDLDKSVLVGGIGCSGRTPFYFNTNAMHTTHGRALAFATGIKMTNPSLTVLVTMGDGDALAIGGNHFIHAARRNIDLTAIIYNNSTYGMTGGQAAPTTPIGSFSTTSPLGTTDPAFDTVELALAAGASFVARGTTYDFLELPQLIAKAVQHPGFAMVEVLTQCPTYYGRMNKIGDATAMLGWERDTTEPLTQFEHLPREVVVGKRPIGIFREEIRSEYSRAYHERLTGGGSHV